MTAKLKTATKPVRNRRKVPTLKPAKHPVRRVDDLRELLDGIAMTAANSACRPVLERIRCLEERGRNNGDVLMAMMDRLGNVMQLRDRIAELLTHSRRLMAVKAELVTENQAFRERLALPPLDIAAIDSGLIEFGNHALADLERRARRKPALQDNPEAERA